MTYLVLAVLAAATVAGLLYRARYGRLRTSTGDLPAGLVPPGLSDGVVLLHFTSPTCAPCRQVKAVCADLEQTLEGVRHVEVDADTHLDAVKSLDIWRLPTLLIVDRKGHIAQRTVGVPDRTELRRAVTEVMAA